MNSRNLALNLMFLSTLSDIDSPEFLLYLTTGVQVGETREGMGQEPLKKVSVHLLFPDSKPHKKITSWELTFFLLLSLTGLRELILSRNVIIIVSYLWRYLTYVYIFLLRTH